MFCTSAGKFFLLVSITQYVPSSASDAPTFDQGWRKHHTKEGLEGLKNKVNRAQGAVALGSVPVQKSESWSLRDKAVTPAFRASKAENTSVEARSPLLRTGSLIMVLLFAAGMCLALCYMAKKAGNQKQVFSKVRSTPFDFILNADLVQQALIVIRHSTTQSMDRACDFIDYASEGLTNSISDLTNRVRKPRWAKKEDPDIDLLELKTQCQQMSTQFVANSLMDLDDKVDSIVKPAEALKDGMQLSMDLLIQSVEEDSDSDSEDEAPCDKASSQCPSDIEDVLGGKFGNMLEQKQEQKPQAEVPCVEQKAAPCNMEEVPDVL